jgi:hypothetical protein
VEDFVSPLVRDWMSRAAQGAGSECAPQSQMTLLSQLAERGVPFPAFADAFAHEVAHLYVSGQISFDEGENAIGWLHHFSLMSPHGDLLDSLAWQVYKAFDAGSYHPTLGPAEDFPQTYTIPRLRQLLSSAEA